MRLLSKKIRPRGEASRRPRGRGGIVRGERGVALIMVTAVIAILTAVAVEFTYRERVNMHLAANARDELRAHYLAESAVNLSRLVLSFQSQVDQLGAGMSQMLSGALSQNPQLAQLAGSAGIDPSMLAGLAGGAAGAGGQGGQGGGLGLRLWELVPVDCGMVQMVAALGAGQTEVNENLDPNAPQLTPFGDFQGGCHAEITDEDSKINVNQLDGLGRQVQTAILSLVSLMQDPRYDFLFEEENSHGLRLTRPEMLVALRDYIDRNEVQETLMQDAQGLPELVAGAGDEGYYYSRYEPRYKPKNAPLDSLDELYQVAGVGDYFMSAFGDRLTVYTDKNAKLNVTPQNMADLCLRMVLAAAPGTAQQVATLCADPAFMTNLWDQIQLQRAMMPWVGIQPAAFKSLLEASGIQTNPLAFSGTNALFGSSSRTFTIKATGQAGDVTKTIVAVVRMDGPDPMGRLLHWEEK